jgi:hypothetical protein
MHGTKLLGIVVIPIVVKAFGFVLPKIALLSTEGCL